ncbi:protoheme IX farnesyltransferase [Batrachochytrium salamandrivorans]|nr:protoheme IX farnesyltransferase [Batrachochytrium salamandrivorans]
MVLHSQRSMDDRLISTNSNSHSSLTYQYYHTLQWRNLPPFQLSYYRDLTKFKLSAFVALTTMAGYAMAPGAASVVSLLCTTGGTALCIASANALNQWTEAPYDAQMSRTRTRILVRHGMSPQHAFVAAVTAGVAGTAILAVTVNPITAVLGAANILLYTCIYTPMKRSSIANTWAGSVAGYRMMCVTHPQLNARVALRYALAMFPICYAAYAIDMVSWLFLDSSIVNAYMAWHAYFFLCSSNPQTARALFLRV